LYGMAECENVGSNKILRKVGLKFIEVFDFNGVMHNWFKIERTDFTSRGMV